MMRTRIANHSKAAKPAGHAQMFGNIEFMSDYFPHFEVVKVAVEFRQGS